MISENVKKVFNDNTWFISTASDEPNVVPVGFKMITEDDKFTIGAVLLETTLENIKKNGKIAIAAADPKTAESYQIKGSAELVYEGEIFDFYKKLADDTFKGAFPAKCAIVVTPEKVIVATPAADNKKILEF